MDLKEILNESVDHVLYENMNDTCNNMLLEFEEVGQQIATVSGIDAIQQKFDEISAKMAAAKRGLGIVNRLQPGDTKVKNARRVMGNMNRIRAELAAITKEIAAALGQ